MVTGVRRYPSSDAGRAWKISPYDASGEASSVNRADGCQAIFFMLSFTSLVKSGAALSAASWTSLWLRGVGERPAALLETQLTPQTRSPQWLAAMASTAVDMPTASAPRAARARISAGLS